MSTRIVLMTIALLGVTLAGCTSGDSPTATGRLALQVDDDSPHDIAILLTGAWVESTDENIGWQRFLAENTTLSLTGSGVATDDSGDVPAANYQRIRFVFSEVTLGGAPLALAETGLEFPLRFTLAEASEITFAITVQWGDAVYETQQGMTFNPVLKAVTVTEGTQQLLHLEAQDIVTGPTTPPVARMRVFDSTGLEVFESDFVAESVTEPLVGNPGQFVFASSGSEALQDGAEITDFSWEFDDGDTMKGQTVTKEFAPGNQTVRLVITDSNGAQDGQNIKIAVKPIVKDVTFEFPFEGTATGVNDGNSGVFTGGEVLHTIAIDGERTPDGEIGNIIQASVRLSWTLCLQDLDLKVHDGVGNEIGSSGNPPLLPFATGDDCEDWSANYPDGSPAGGDWVIEVVPYSAANQAYTGLLSVTWNVKVGEPGYILWISAYEDGHDHQH